MTHKKHCPCNIFNFYRELKRITAYESSYKPRYILIEPIEKVTSEKVNTLIEDMLKNEKVLSMTNDNVSESRKHMKWNVPVYHYDPIKPDQRGSIENVIGTLRPYISRKTRLDDIGREGIKEI